jgi:energy-converting hydrogenase Eha subunit C
MKKILRYILAILLGIAAVFLVQMGLTKIWGLNGISWGPGNLPFETIQKIAMLSSGFVAGAAGPFLSVLIARSKAPVIIIVFLLIGLGIDIYAALVPLKPLALWFRIAWVLSVLLQVYVGVQLGGQLLKGEEAPRKD